MEASLIVDIGSSSTKIGFTGDDVPSWVIPTSVDRGKGDKDANAVENVGFNPSKDLEREDTAPSGVLMHRGQVHDWDEMEKFWETITNEVGMNTVNVEKTPVLLIDSPLSKISDRVKWAEILFEGYHVPSICIGNSASLSVFAAGRATGVVVDIGGGLMTAVPVFEGLALMHACVEMDYAGMDITGRLKKTLLDQSGINLSFADARTLKERFAYVSKTAPTPLPTMKRRGTKSKDASTEPAPESINVFLPDGTECTIDQRIFGDCTEGLMKNKESTFGGLSKSVYESLVLCDNSIMGELKNNIIISGGTSMLTGLGDRLTNDLNEFFENGRDGEAQLDGTAGTQLRVMPSSFHRESGYTNQRKYAAWQGGSIFASFESFKNLRVTRQEFEEGVESSLLAKCF